MNTVVYYGISMSTDSLGVNKYIAFAIAGAVEVPANFLCHSSNRKVGEKTGLHFLHGLIWSRHFSHKFHS